MVRKLQSLIGKTKGFTLIELLIVIAIIAILTVAFLPNALKAPARARDAGKVKTTADIQAAIEGYIASHDGKYPGTPVGDGDLVETNPGTTTLGIDVKVNTYYYYNGSTGTPPFYAVGFTPDNTGTANSSATVTTFTADSQQKTAFPTTGGTGMYVAVGPM